MVRALVIVVMMWVWCGPVCHALDGPGASAVRLIEQGVAPRRDGRHVLVLQALRELRDPAMRPWWAALAARDDAPSAAQGLVALGQLADPPGLELSRLIDVNDPAVERLAVGYALGADLLPPETAEAMLAWESLDPALGFMLLLSLEPDRWADYEPLLRGALAGDHPGQRATAALLLASQGDVDGQSVLDGLLVNDDLPEPVLAELLQIAQRKELAAIATWGQSIAERDRFSEALRLRALQTALALDAPDAEARLLAEYQSASRLAQRLRLSASALWVADRLSPAVFERFVGDGSELIQQIGATGLALQSSDTDHAAAVLELIPHNNPVTSAWVLDHAENAAEPTDAQVIALGVIDAVANDQTINARYALLATRRLVQIDPDAGVRLVQPYLVGRPNNPAVVEAVLAGLLNLDDPLSPDQLASLDLAFTDQHHRNLALILRATAGTSLDEGDLRRLGQLAQGAGRVSLNLRVRAAWRYLQYTDQTDEALTRLTAVQ